MEEASELLYRMDNKKELLPQFTSAVRHGLNLRKSSSPTDSSLVDW